jgi:predicted porin
MKKRTYWTLQGVSSHKTLALIAALCGVAGVAHADGPSSSDKLPGLGIADPLPDTLSWGGVTLYGTIDVGYAYESRGVPLNNTFSAGLDSQLVNAGGNRVNDKAQSTVAEYGLSQSVVGLRLNRPAFDDVKVVGQLETAFSPLSGQIVDTCKSIADNSGKPASQQTASGDSSMCGQPFRLVYGGFEKPQWGTLTFGRQNNVLLSVIVPYDPQSGSYAFSLVGWLGTISSGSGSTETTRLNSSVKYSNAFGPVHIAAIYSAGGEGTGALQRSIGGDVGALYGGASLDAVVESTNGAVNLRGTENNVMNPLTTSSGAGVPPGLNGYLSNNTTWNILAKYAIDLDQGADGSAGDKLTLSAGYLHVRRAPNHLALDTAFEATGDYPAFVGLQLDSNLIIDTAFAGAKYQLAPHWNFSGGYYRYHQSAFTIGVVGKSNLGCSAAGSLCAGDTYVLSGVVDYAVNKHYDFYAGINWSKATDGVASAFPSVTSPTGTSGSISTTNFVTGFRIRI